MLVDVQHGQSRHLRGRRDQQVGYRRPSMLAAVCQGLLNGDGAVLDGGRQASVRPVIGIRMLPYANMMD